jgi:hypothetical protein
MDPIASLTLSSVNKQTYASYWLEPRKSRTRRLARNLRRLTEGQDQSERQWHLRTALDGMKVC